MIPTAPILRGAIRHAMTAGGGALSMTTADLQQWLGIASMIIGIVWSVIEKLRRAPELKPRTNILPIILRAALALTLTGCKTTNPQTGQKEYDAAKTDAVKAVVKPFAASIVRRVVQRNPTTAPYFTRAADTFADARDAGAITPQALAAQLNAAADEQGCFQRDDEAAEILIDAKNLLLALYEVNYAGRFAVDLPAETFLWHLLDTFAKAIEQGIMDAGQATTATPPMPPMPPSPTRTAARTIAPTLQAEPLQDPLPDAEPVALAFPSPGIPTAIVRIEPDTAKILTITWTNLPESFKTGYRIEISQDLATGFQAQGSSTSAVNSIVYATRTGPNPSFYRVSPLVGDSPGPVYGLQWPNGNPELVVWHPAQPPPEPTEPPEPPEPIETAIGPSDDAYLQTGVRINDQTLKIQAGSRIAYLKFAVAVTGSVQTATLQLQENGDPGQGTLRAWRGSHNNWTETALSSATAPAKTSALGKFEGAIGPNQTISINLANLISTNGIYSVIIDQDAGGNDVWFGSKESTRPPRLVLSATPK